MRAALIPTVGFSRDPWTVKTDALVPGISVLDTLDLSYNRAWATERHLDKKGPWGENYEVKKIPVRVGRGEFPFPEGLVPGTTYFCQERELGRKWWYLR